MPSSLFFHENPTLIREALAFLDRRQLVHAQCASSALYRLIEREFSHRAPYLQLEWLRYNDEAEWSWHQVGGGVRPIRATHLQQLAHRRYIRFKVVKIYLCEQLRRNTTPAPSGELLHSIRHIWENGGVVELVGFGRHSHAAWDKVCVAPLKDFIARHFDAVSALALSNIHGAALRVAELFECLPHCHSYSIRDTSSRLLLEKCSVPTEAIVEFLMPKDEEVALHASRMITLSTGHESTSRQQIRELIENVKNVGCFGKYRKVFSNLALRASN